MYVLRKTAYRYLGPKWQLFKNIKQGKLRLLRGKNKVYTEYIKTTKAALRNISKVARKAYYEVYQSSLEEIVANTSLYPKDLPEIREIENETDIPSLTAEQDATIISWTPIKFMLPVTQIRKLRRASLNYCENLSAMLIFKVVAYYAVPENWEIEKLVVILNRTSSSSTYEEIVQVLEPFKNDLQTFVSAIEPFKFGQEASSETQSNVEERFLNTIGENSVKSQVNALFWYDFIYEALELFLFRYFITLVTAAKSPKAIQYLSSLLEPVLSKTIDCRVFHLGILEVDDSKRSLRLPFEKYKREMNQLQLRQIIETNRGAFETYFYHSKLLQKTAIKFDIMEKPRIESEWGQFVAVNILGLAHTTKQINAEDAPGEETREYALMQILSTMAVCNQYRKSARYKVLGRFKEQVILEVKRTGILTKKTRKEAEAKICQMEQKISDMSSKKDKHAISAKAGLISYKSKIDKKCESIKQNMKAELNTRKLRLKEYFGQLGRMNLVNTGIASIIIFKMTEEIDPNGSFVKEFIRFVIQNIQDDFSKSLTPFYENVFDILQPSVHEKVAIIQSLQKSGVTDAFGLTLDEQEAEQFRKLVEMIRDKIVRIIPDILVSHLLFSSIQVPLEKLLKVGIDNRSLQLMLSLRLSSPVQRNPYSLPLKMVKQILFLNTIQHSVPKYYLIKEGCENETDPLKAINTKLLKDLLHAV
ncbi:MAG: hypothetical protein HQ517_18220 [SAR324 cluster bacterium]|nr:hypothetical protein [SAR324 cluster bacterium]